MNSPVPGVILIDLRLIAISLDSIARVIREQHDSENALIVIKSPPFIVFVNEYDAKRWFWTPLCFLNSSRLDDVCDDN